MEDMDLEKARAATVQHIVGPTILMGSGNYFDLEEPEACVVTLEDISWGLANTSRFRGQTVLQINQRRCYYSVAQHCVIGSLIIEPEYALEFLMHESGEVPWGDNTTPHKDLLPVLRVYEKRSEHAILRQISVHITNPTRVKEVDLRLMATEKRDLTPSKGHTWHTTGAAQPYDDIAITDPWPPARAAAEFERRYRQLC